MLLGKVGWLVDVLGPGDRRVTDAADDAAAVDVLPASAGSLTVSANEATCEEVEFRAVPDVSNTELVVMFEDMPRRLVVVADDGGVAVVVSDNAALVPNA